MCGIVGYLGSRKAAEVIVEGLSKLEYRGYDSAGVAVNSSNEEELNIRKFKGRLSVLAEDLEKNPIDGNLGIGHTRWATHGEPSDVNSHPHFNQAKTIAVVHNGIIENYMEIKEELISEGVKFESQTDTEVIAHLVDKYYEGNLLDAVYKTISKLRGAYALGVICKEHGNELVAVRKDSPLVVGVGEGENFIASEFRYSDPFVDENSLVILVSQSGETADTLAVLRDSKAKGARILSITNVVGSSIARESDDVFYTWAGPEVAVASTKAYTTQITSLYMIALDFAIKKGTITREFYDSMISKMKEIPSKIQEILDNEEYIKEVAKTVVSSEHAFYLGRGIDYSLAMEGSLKLKEISYIHAEAFAAGELKHGTIALIEKGTPVIAIATQEKLFEKMVSNMEEVRARGAYVVAIAQSHNKDVEKAADKIIYIPNSDDILSPILAVVPMQLLAYHVSVLRGCDVDKPRNLAKSVTVE